MKIYFGFPCAQSSLKLWCQASVDIQRTCCSVSVVLDCLQIGTYIHGFGKVRRCSIPAALSMYDISRIRRARCTHSVNFNRHAKHVSSTSTCTEENESPVSTYLWVRSAHSARWDRVSRGSLRPIPGLYHAWFKMRYFRQSEGTAYHLQDPIPHDYIMHPLRTYRAQPSQLQSKPEPPARGRGCFYSLQPSSSSASPVPFSG